LGVAHGVSTGYVDGFLATQTPTEDKVDARWKFQCNTVASRKRVIELKASKNAFYTKMEMISIFRKPMYGSAKTVIDTRVGKA
jgi:protein tyrosine phosphatase